jgi:hypothetical protein
VAARKRCGVQAARRNLNPNTDGGRLVLISLVQVMSKLITKKVKVKRGSAQVTCTRAKGKKLVLPARFELAIFGLLLEFQAHFDYETDALPTEPRKHYKWVKQDRFHLVRILLKLYVRLVGSVENLV